MKLLILGLLAAGIIFLVVKLNPKAKETILNFLKSVKDKVISWIFKL